MSQVNERQSTILVLQHVHHISLFVGFQSRKMNRPCFLRKNGVVPAYTDIFSHTKQVAPLSYNDGTCLGLETWKELDAQSSTGRITTIVRRTSGFLGGCSNLLKDNWTSLC